MKKFLCVLALSACVFACGKEQTREKSRAETEHEMELQAHERALIEAKQNAISHLMSTSAQRAEQDPTKEKQSAEEVESTPTPANAATPTPNPVESITPEASATSTVTETPILSPIVTPTPTSSSTPESTVETSEASEKPFATSTPQLRLNPVATGTPFPQATALPEFDLSSSPTSVQTESQPQANEESPAATVPSWIRNASGKKRAKPSVSPSPSP